jgi:hypothetical protein
VVDLRDGKDVVTANLLQFRVSQEDMKELDHPLFLDDGQQFYVALNIRQQNNKILRDSVANNFQSGARCLPVNGWFVALDRKGEFLWHGHDRYQHQLIVVEQFKSLPVLLFSSRYMEMAAPGQGYQYFARTGSVNKATGKDIKWTDKRPTNGAVQYYAFNIDLKAGTISMVGTNTVDQWYVEQAGEPKKADQGPEAPAGAVKGLDGVNVRKFFDFLCKGNDFARIEDMRQVKDAANSHGSLSSNNSGPIRNGGSFKTFGSFVMSSDGPLAVVREQKSGPNVKNSRPRIGGRSSGAVQLSPWWFPGSGVKTLKTRASGAWLCSAAWPAPPYCSLRPIRAPVLTRSLRNFAELSTRAWNGLPASRMRKATGAPTATTIPSP